MYVYALLDEDSGDEITFKKEENVVEKESTKRKSKLKEKFSVKKQKTVKDINAAILKEHCLLYFW